MDSYSQDYSVPAAQAAPEARAEFIRKTYLHLAGAVLLFAVIEYFLIHSPVAEMMFNLIGSSRYGWLLLLGGFIAASWMATHLAHKQTSAGIQYLGLLLLIIAEAVIFVPMIYIAVFYSDPSVLPTAAIMTGVLFAGLTFTAFTMGTDFSFLRGILTIGGFAAMGLILCAVIFGLQLGTWFSVVMIVFAGGAILYDTSNIMRHYPTDRHVAASLELFASVAMMFWYVLRLFMSRD